MADGSDFSTELRGYKRSKVDEALADLKSELIRASRDRATALEELTQVKAQLEELTAQVEPQGGAGYANLGGRLEAVLRIAEEQSTRIISQADIDAELVIGSAKDEAKATRQSARSEAERAAEAAVVDGFRAFQGFTWGVHNALWEPLFGSGANNDGGDGRRR